MPSLPPEDRNYPSSPWYPPLRIGESEAIGEIVGVIENYGGSDRRFRWASVRGFDEVTHPVTSEKVRPDYIEVQLTRTLPNDWELAGVTISGKRTTRNGRDLDVSGSVNYRPGAIDRMPKWARDYITLVVSTGT